MKHMTRTLAMVATMAVTGGMHAYAAEQILQPAVMYGIDPDAGAAEDDYSSGMKAMNEQRWSEAIAAFDKVIAARGSKTQAAMYWKAYSLSKVDRRQESASTCGALHSEFPSSSWNKDCSALGIRTKNVRVIMRKSDNDDDEDDIITVAPIPPMAPISPMAPMAPQGPISISMNGRHESSDPNTDLKILALNSLMHQDASKAIPVLRDLLNGNQTDRVKKQALFVLGNNKAPECQALLREVALGKQNPNLQREAMQMLAITQGKKANDTLAEIYKQSQDGKVKKSAISAMFISGDAQRMVELARGEKDLEMKRQIVSQLALMNDKSAQDYMLELLK